MADWPTGTVTFLFTDIEGSTRLWEQQPQAMQAALARHDALLRHAIETQGGHVFKTIGDGFCAAFARLDAAVAAALSAQKDLSEVEAPLAAAPSRAEERPREAPLRVWMAVHTGAAVYREGDYFGPALNRVARLLNAGHGGQVLLSAATAEQLRPEMLAEVDLRSLGVHRLRDIAVREAIFQLLAPGLPTRFPSLNTLDVAFRRGAIRAAAAAGVILAVVSSLAVIAANQARLARQAARREARQRYAALEGQRALRRHLYGSQMMLARQAWEAGVVQRARDLLDAYRPAPGEEDLRGLEWRLLWPLCHDEEASAVWRTQGGEYAFGVLSPDGRLLATPAPKGLELWDVATGRRVAAFPGSPNGDMDSSSSVLFSPDAKTLAVIAWPGQEVRIWDVASRHRIGTIRDSSPLSALAFSPDSRMLVAGTETTLHRWDVAARRPVTSLPRPGKGPLGLASTRGGQFLSTCTLAFTPRGQLLSTCPKGSMLEVWDPVRGRRVAALRGAALISRVHGRGPVFSPDRRLLAAAEPWAGRVRLWEITSQRLLATFPVPPGNSVKAGLLPGWAPASGRRRRFHPPHLGPGDPLRGSDLPWRGFLIQLRRLYAGRSVPGLREWGPNGAILARGSPRSGVRAREREEPLGPGLLPGWPMPGDRGQ